ncbi:MAG: hypothetical protein GX797_00840 [Chloroflexi bacterium]|nr:hypothetical protein [Chloroflexota bacterium]
MNEKPNTKKHVLVLVGIFLVTALVISACVMPGPVQPTVDPIEQAMQTLQAQATQDFYSTVVSQLTATSEVPPGTTPDPTNINQIPGNTQVPTVAITQIVSTPVPTQIPTAAFTPTQIPPTPTPRPCYQVTFVSDVTIPDGSKIVAGTSFTKTWRLKNSGTCKWDTGFDIVFVSGHQLGANAVYDFPKDVAPGETVDISINMVAPLAMGKYESNWMLFSNNGIRFGTGSDSKGPFWARIESVDGKGIVYNFADRACDAKWSSGSRGSLPCPGDEKQPGDGYVVAKNKPVREDGGVENEAGLITRPNNANDGYIQGIYPAFRIKDGDKFHAAVQCAGNTPGCKLKFELYIREVGGSFVELGEWREVYDQMWTYVEVDLSAYAGKDVEFSLVAWNDGSTTNNIGLWLYPVIDRTK